MKKWRNRIFLMILCAAFLCTGCRGDFDAAGYTEALLHLMFQGDTKEAMKRIDGATDAEIPGINQYLYDKCYYKPV